MLLLLGLLKPSSWWQQDDFTSQKHLAWTPTPHFLIINLSRYSPQQPIYRRLHQTSLCSFSKCSWRIRQSLRGGAIFSAFSQHAFPHLTKSFSFFDYTLELYSSLSSTNYSQYTATHMLWWSNWCQLFSDTNRCKERHIKKLREKHVIGYWIVFFQRVVFGYKKHSLIQ